MLNNTQEFTGLTDKEVLLSRQKWGYNVLDNKPHRNFLFIIRGIVTEPMFLLLTAACLIYFITGTYLEGFVMLGAIAIVSGISIFQEIRTENALNALKKLSEPRAKVIRNRETLEILTEEIVVGDIIQVEEGNVIPADATILQSNDFSVNESILTGESYAVARDGGDGNSQIYFGTLVVSGSAIAKVNATGQHTEMGRIGKSLEHIRMDKTPLQQQIGSFVRKMATLGAILFGVVWVVNYIESRDVVHGLLHGLTLAMSVLPEEIPVAFTTFMALGAWRLMKKGVLAKHLQTVESLGSATVICIDKTGTITKNKMRLARIYDFVNDRFVDVEDCRKKSELDILTYAMWASEPVPFDPMEKAIYAAYKKMVMPDRPSQFRMIHEYPIGGVPPLMTHIYENDRKERIIAAKGAWEGLISHAELPEEEINHISTHAHELAAEGYRVLGVARTDFKGYDFPENQEDFDWEFLGLIALEDPPKKNMKKVFNRFYSAGIEVKIITGDYPETTLSIARQTGFRHSGSFLRGEEIIRMTEDELRAQVKKVNIFARMFPEAKLRVIEALKADGEVVSMTGDGVNDAPALKSAHIGVAMGKRGTETAKRSASMILLEDDLDNMAEAIAHGRRIYANLKKAIQYIISIHIPIMLTVVLPLLLGWKYSNIFSPLHVIFFELIMGPTCSIIFENEPLEQSLMKQKPRKMTDTFFSIHELAMSVVQGLVITSGVLLIYYITMEAGFAESLVRTLVFTTIILSNIFLTLENRSFYFPITRTIRYANRLVPVIIFITLTLLILILSLPVLRKIFGLDLLNFSMFMITAVISFISVIWAEIYKWFKRKRMKIKAVG